jgi:hypothetical protein
MTEPPADEDLLKAILESSLTLPSREDIIAKLRASGDPRAAAIIKDIEKDIEAELSVKPPADPPAHSSGFRLLKGGKE